MKKIILILLILSTSCAEKLMEKPDNLIAKDKMILILNDLAILNAGKATNVEILKKHKIDPTDFIFERYAIDSIQFVESDRYYASIPNEHEEIYVAVEAKLLVEKERLASLKKIRDSLKTIERKSNMKGFVKDSL